MVKVHHRSKAVQATTSRRSISLSSFKCSTMPCSTSPFKIEAYCLKPPKSALTKEYMFDDPSLFFSLKNWRRVERIKFAQYLGRNLPHRYLYSILMRFKNLYKHKIVGKFDTHTDKILLKHMNAHKVPSYSKLSKILDRDKHSLYRRCQLLKQMQDNPDLHNRMKWNYKIIEKLLRSMLNVCNINDITELKNKTIFYDTWLDIEKKSGIPARRAKKFWLTKLHTQLFAVNCVTKNEISIKLIEIFCQMKYKYWQDVKWNEIFGYFDDDGLTSSFLYHRWRALLKKFVPKEKRHILTKTVKILKRIVPIIKESKNSSLEKLIYTKSDGLKIV